MNELLKSNEKLWDLFTKKEEYNPPALDRHQRFAYCLSKHRNVLEPEVSDFLIRNGLKFEYPDGKKFAVCLTHDVDIIYMAKLRLPYETVAKLLKSQIKNAFKIVLRNFYKQFNPLLNFVQIMELEKKYDAKSSFYILAIDKMDFDFNYRIEDIKNELKIIIDNGWEVGLHGGYEAYDNLYRIKKEKEILERVIGKQVIGYRNHFLRFKTPKTWELLREAGFKYDTTFGYADYAGFRNGMCHPFRPFNLNTNTFMDILEIPLNIMDRTLDSYMRLNVKDSWEIIKRLIDIAEKYNGVVTILWHNNCMANEKLELYERILEYCYEKNAWMTSGEAIWNWWGKNNFFDKRQV